MIPFQLHRRIPLVRRPFFQRDVALQERNSIAAERDRLAAELQQARALITVSGERNVRAELHEAGTESPEHIANSEDFSRNAKGQLWVRPKYVTDLSTCCFYHSMDLPEVGFQEGSWDLRGKFSDYIGDVNCAGQRVLDIGCASGFLSFAAESAGASEVVSFDMDSATRQHLLPFHKSEYFTNHEAWVDRQSDYIKQWHNAYWLSHRLYKSKALVYHGDVYDIPDALGTFDVTIVGAVLEHLADPIRALASISRRTNDIITISAEVIETEEAVARFAGNAELPQINYVFWVYSLGTYRHVLKMLGFEIVRTVKRDFVCVHYKGAFPRTAIVARRVEQPV